MNPFTLITGASGFLGFNFIKNSGMTNYILTSRNNDNKLQKLETKNYIFGDLYTGQNLEKISTMKFDRLIHFAWEGLPIREKYYNNKNYANTTKLIDLMLTRNPNCEINMMGSCLEYGDYIGQASENTEGVSLDNFAETKLKVLEFLSKCTDNYRWFRIFYPYGYGQHKNSILNYCFQEYSKQRIPKLKNQNISHDYIYVDDVTSLISKAINIEELKGVINIGSGKLTSNYEIFCEISEQMGQSLESFKDFNSRGLQADMSKVNKFVLEFNYTNLKEGVSKYLESANRKN